LSIDAQNVVRLQYPTIESSTSENKYKNEVYSTGCVTILCNFCSNYVKSFPLPCTIKKRSDQFYRIHKRFNCPESKENKWIQTENQNLIARVNIHEIEVKTLKTQLRDAEDNYISETSNLLGFGL